MNKTTKFLDLFGLISIGIFSLGYIWLNVPLAELHIQLSFLDFPIFIGEILLFICLVIFIFRCGITPLKLNRWYYVLIPYLIFVITKALIGYTQYGPLAFRDAALFYYPLFILLGYCFYQRDYFSSPWIFLIFLPIVLILFSMESTFTVHWALSCSILGFALLVAYPNKLWRYALLAVLVAVTPYKLFFHTSRMMLVSNIITGIYLIIVFYIIIPFNRKIKLMFVILGILFFGAGTFMLSYTARAKSIISLRELIILYNEYDKVIQQKMDHYKLMKVNKIRLFNEESKENDLYAYFKMEEFRKKELPDSHTEISDAGMPKDFKGYSTPIEIIQVGEKVVKQYGIPIGYYHNALFRLFIWRDMINELKKGKPIFGFSFGKPLRSISLEILNWGTVEWERDGWIAPHNSYLHIIYRSGLVGILFILTILIMLFRMIIIFIQAKSVIGVLLCGIIINWFVAANFLLIFELPYTAIPIWSLYGITLAYCYKPPLDKKKDS